MNEGEKIVDIRRYLREYVRITITCIRNPGKFFEEIKNEGRKYLKPIAYLLTSSIIFDAGLFSWLLFPSEEFNSVKTVFSQQMIFISLVSGGLLMAAHIILLYLAVKLVGGKGRFNDTLKVVCYSSSPLNFAWVFGVGMVVIMYLKNTIALLIAIPLLLAIFASSLYMYYIEVVGLSVTSEITKLRGFAAVVIQGIIYSIIAIILSIGVLLYSIVSPAYSGSSPISYPSPSYGDYTVHPLSDERQNITVYAGSTPWIDGIVDTQDKWDEGEKSHAQIEEKNYTIITKHDFENIYILIQVNGPEDWKDVIAMHFEQDENDPDYNLKTGVTDTYTYAADLGGTARFRDGHYNITYTDIEDQNSFLITGYKDGIWSLEWQIPLRSGDKHDIYVEKYPVRLGFALIDWTRGARGIWPRSANPNKPETWGDMTIIGAPYKQETGLENGNADSYKPEPKRYNVTAYAGSAPQLDGVVTVQDKWYEGERFTARDKKRTYYVTIKHDFKDIYILMEWETPYKQSGNMIILFEQDGDKQNFDLLDGRVDGYIQDYYRDENLSGSDIRYGSDSSQAIQALTDSVSDMHHVSYGYANDEHKDGSLRGIYVNSRWTLEWKIPMKSGDKDDIYIDRYPIDVGFAITNPIIAQEEGIFPPGADNHNPLTWGTMTITGEKAR